MAIFSGYIPSDSHQLPCLGHGKDHCTAGLLQQISVSGFTAVWIPTSASPQGFFTESLRVNLKLGCTMLYPNGLRV